MLQSIDVLIGLSVVMLVVSMAVTLINQAILTAIASRGRCLKAGLSDLLVLLDAGLTRKHADEIAASILKYPTIQCNNHFTWLGALFPSLKLGEVIHREEFAKMLLNFGASYREMRKKCDNLNDAIKNRGDLKGAVSDMKAALDKLDLALSRRGLIGWLISWFGPKTKLATILTTSSKQSAFQEFDSALSKHYADLGMLHAALDANGISDPAHTLDNVRMLTLQIEKSQPELANDVRQSNALLQAASSAFLGKINSTFDQFMDRVSARFTYSARVYTFLTAAFVAVVLQLDAVCLINRLAMDDKMREAFVHEAMTLNSDVKARNVALESPAAQGQNASPAIPKEDVGPDNVELERKYLNFLALQGVIKVPISSSLETKGYHLPFVEGPIQLPTVSKEWRAGWKTVSIPGLLLSILLLNLGAPFWYNTLGQLLQLRSSLARKDDEQRSVRQTAQGVSGETAANTVKATAAQS